MDIRSAFPSKYVSAVDLAQSPGRSVRVVIGKVVIEHLPGTRGREDENKPILYFRGKKKGLVLNKTNANALAHHLGWDTENWVGQMIELFTAEVEAFGEMVEAIRVRVPKKAPQPKPPPPAEDEVQQAPEEPHEQNALDALDPEEPF